MFINKVLNKGYEAERCSICSGKFTLVLRIHKCKRCERFVCANCGKHKDYFVQEDGTKSADKHRVCVLCKEDIDFLKETASSYEMSWGCSSNFSRQWLSKLPGINLGDYDTFLRLFHHNRQHYEEAYETIEKDVMMGRTDLCVFNSSMRDLLFKVQRDKTKDSTRRSMANVLSAVTGKHNELGYCQGMSNIAAFLLCFGSEVDAFFMFCDLLQNILPEKLYEKSGRGTNLIGLLAELAFLKEYFIVFMSETKQKSVSEQEAETFHTVIEIMGAKCLLTLFIGNLSFINLMFLWKELARCRSFEVIERTLLAVMYLFQEKIVASASRYKLLEKFIELLDHSQFRQIYEEVRIDQKRRAEIIAKFYSGFSRQWNDQDKGVIRKLEKMTKFSGPELELMQQSFRRLIQNKVLPWLKEAGITEEQFLAFFRKYLSSTKIGFIEGYDEDYFSNVFRKQDQDNSGFLDFRQFVCCLSTLVRGNLRDRLALLSETLQDERGYVDAKRFADKLRQLFELIRKAVEPDEELNQLEETFNLRAKSFYFEQKRISSSEIHVLINDPFINEVTLRTLSDASSEGIELVLQSM